MNTQGLCKILKDNIKNSNRSIVFDIDSTIIDLNGNRIEEIAYIYNFSKGLGYNIFFITARQGDKVTIDSTKKQLSTLNLEGYNMIFFCPIDQIDVAWYKEFSRKLLFNMGYDIIMSIGDMPWDIGRYGGLGVIINAP